jgi:hypothetical protein
MLHTQFLFVVNRKENTQMSNDLAILNSNLPAHLRSADALDDVTKALMGGTGGIKRISIEGSVWRLMVNGKEVAQKEERTLNAVIVAAAPKVARTYYAGVYKKGAVSAPDCWSADGEKPDPTAANPQHKTCTGCPQNIKGSGQGEGRACRFSRRLAVVLDNDLNGDVYQLTLPSTSIFGEGEPGKWPLEMYAKMIGAKGIPITAVVTEMRFDTSSATPKVTFKPVRFLEADEHAVVIEKGKSDDAQKAITMTVAQADGVGHSAPKVEAQDENDVIEALAQPAKAKKAEAKVEVEVEAPEPEPVKREAKKEEVVEKADLSNILDEWDD